jgi:hypothetical protein
MSTAISLQDLWNIIKDDTPAENGVRLAKALLARDEVDWDDLIIDLRGMSIELLNISFFYGFLRRIAEARPELLTRARRVKWTLSYHSLEELVATFMISFQPRPSKNAA